MAQPTDVDAAIAAYRRTRAPGNAPSDGFWGTLADIMMFRVMITPWLVRYLFIFAVGATLFAGAWSLRQRIAGAGAARSAATSEQLLTGTVPPSGPMTPSDALIGVYVQWASMLGVVSPLLWLVGFRIICEFCIVIFRISEDLREVRDTLGQTGK